MRSLALAVWLFATALPLFGTPGSPFISLDLITRCQSSDLDSPKAIRVSVTELSTQAQTSWSVGLGSHELATDALPTGTWRIRAEVEGHWSPTLDIDSRSTQRLELPLYPAATLQGNVRHGSQQSAEARELPNSITARIESLSVVSESCTVEQTTVDCPVALDESPHVSGGATWNCTVPATRLNIRLSAPGSVPDYRWNVTAPAGGVAKVAPYELRSGASLSGWVAPPPERQLPPDVTVRLEPLKSVIALPNPLELSHASVRTFEHRPDGFWQAENLLPGRYRLRASSEQEGWIGHGATVQVVEDAETTLRQPIELLAPTAFEITLSPPTDPYGTPWNLHLRSNRVRQEESPLTAASVEASAAGIARVEGLLPGPYHLVVESPQRGKWLSQSFDLSPEPEPLHLEIPLIEIEGDVAGLDPEFPGTLFFVHPKSLDRVVMDPRRGNDHFAFEGYVPRPGRWQPYVSSNELQVRWGLPVEEIAPTAPGEVLYLELEIPNGEIRGVVETTEGLPVSGANVTASLIGEVARSTKTTTDSEGRFTLEALTRGEYTISAYANRQHPVHQVVQVEGPSDEELVLTFPGSRSVEILVLDPQGQPVPAATVSMISISSQRGISYPDPIHTTRPDGRTSFGQPDFLEDYVVLVLPPGGTVALERVRLEPGQKEVEIILPTWGGTLELEGLDGTRAYLRYLGYSDRPPAEVPVFSFRSWSLLRGYPVAPPRQVIPDMPAGLYELCPRPPAGWFGHTSNDGCVRQRLLPGGVATLALDAEATAGETREGDAASEGGLGGGEPARDGADTL